MCPCRESILALGYFQNTDALKDSQSHCNLATYCNGIPKKISLGIPSQRAIIEIVGGTRRLLIVNAENLGVFKALASWTWQLVRDHDNLIIMSWNHRVLASYCSDTQAHDNNWINYSQTQAQYAAADSINAVRQDIKTRTSTHFQPYHKKCRILMSKSKSHPHFPHPKDREVKISILGIDQPRTHPARIPFAKFICNFNCK